MTCNDPYATHQPILAAVVSATKGPVLECGAGYYSTPLLHALCRERMLVTVETDKYWVREFKPYFDNKKHLYFPSLAEADLLDELWDVVFVDGKSWERIEPFQRFKTVARFFVVHDTENKELYKMEPEFSNFINRLDFVTLPNRTLQTTILSNEDLDRFKGLLPG